MQLEAELAESRQHADASTESLRQELKAANDNVTRLDQDIRQRDSELEGLAHRVVAHEDDAEEARTELAALKREQTHAADEHRRVLADLTARAESAQAELDAVLRGKGEADGAADTLRERVATLEAELEKLRKQVRDLQAESANREVQITQMEKQRDRDREDLHGLNIALDSKQQEVELVSVNNFCCVLFFNRRRCFFQLKRRMSVVKGTAVGPTPAPSKVGHIRRESTTSFSPPPTHSSRPASRLSDDNKDAPKAGKASSDGVSSTTTTTTRVTTLGKSVRINAIAAATATSPTSITNKLPTPTTIKPTRTIDGPRQRASLSATTSPTSSTHTRVPSISSAFGRSATKSPPATTTTAAAARAPLRRPRPSSMSGTELLRQAKLASSASASSASDMDRSSDEKENTMRLAMRAPVAPSGSLSAASKRRSMIAAPMS